MLPGLSLLQDYPSIVQSSLSNERRRHAAPSDGFLTSAGLTLHMARVAESCQMICSSNCMHGESASRGELMLQVSEGTSSCPACISEANEAMCPKPGQKVQMRANLSADACECDDANEAALSTCISNCACATQNKKPDFARTQSALPRASHGTSPGCGTPPRQTAERPDRGGVVQPLETRYKIKCKQAPSSPPGPKKLCYVSRLLLVHWLQLGEHVSQSLQLPLHSILLQARSSKIFRGKATSCL